MNNFNLSDEKVNTLLQIAATKLGKDPQELRDQLESGSLDNLTKGLNPVAAKQFQSMLSNPKAAESLLSDSKVQTLLSGLLGKK